jgi:hypothetical protein
MYDPHDKNYWSLAGDLKGQIKCDKNRRGDLVTSFVLVNRQRTPDGVGKVLDYKVSVPGDCRADLDKRSTDQQISVSGILLQSSFGKCLAWCLATELDLVDAEEYPVHKFEISGKFCGKPYVCHHGSGDQTRTVTIIAVQQTWWTGFSRRHRTLAVPVLGDKLESLEKINASPGNGILIQGRLSVGSTSPEPLGWRYEIDLATQEWRVKV